MAFGGVYDTGTITIDTGADATAVTGIGTLWSVAQIEPGDRLEANGLAVTINSVTDDTHLVLESDWPGGDLIASAYIIRKDSWNRVDTGFTQAKARALLEGLSATAIIHAVSGSVPDPALGEDGQFALKAAAGVWTLWDKVDGEWIEQGSPTGIDPEGAYSAATAYVAGDCVSYNGRAWLALQPSTGQTPAVGSSYWMALTGDNTRLEIRISDIGKPGALEAFVRELCTTAVTFRSGLAGAYGMVTVAPTADAVFSLRKLTAADAAAAADGPAEIAAATQFATLTFLAGQKSGTFVCASDTSFAAGDLFLIVAPSTQDATLSGLSMSVVAYGVGA